jgi:hypothetical protein
MKIYVHLWQHLAEFFLEWKMFQINCVDKIMTHFLCSITLFRKSCRLWGNVEKILQSRASHMWQYSLCPLHAGCLYKYTLRICNTYRFSTVTMVARTHLKFALYVYCLSCYIRWAQRWEFVWYNKYCVCIFSIFYYVLNILVCILRDEYGRLPKRVEATKKLRLYLYCMCKGLFYNKTN